MKVSSNLFLRIKKESEDFCQRAFNNGGKFFLLLVCVFLFENKARSLKKCLFEWEGK